MNPIIKIQNVDMVFRMTDEKTDTLKKFIIKSQKGRLKYREFKALNDISFSVEKGDSIALIGKNGSGKSTLLKIISGVMRQTRGSVIVNGSIAPLIELGAGFDMELTARENIYLNGAVLGFNRRFMDSKFSDIVEFSELSEFVDVPIKNFSSGMIARLGFSIATVVKADILIVDEVLAVGDYRFQQKCMERISELMAEGTTLLFVSHSPEQVKALCSKAAWLDRGNLVEIGESRAVVDHYLSSQN